MDEALSIWNNLMTTLSTIIKDLCDRSLVAKADIDTMQNKGKLKAFEFNTACGVDAAKVALSSAFENESSKMLNLAFIEFAFRYMSLCTEQYLAISDFHKDFDNKSWQLANTGYVSESRIRDNSVSQLILNHARTMATRNHYYLRSTCKGERNGDFDQYLTTFVSHIAKVSRPSEYDDWTLVRQSQFDNGISLVTTGFIFEIVNNKNNIYRQAVQHHIDTVLLPQLDGVNGCEVSFYEKDSVNGNIAALRVAIESVMLEKTTLPRVKLDTLLASNWLSDHISTTDKTVKPLESEVKDLQGYLHYVRNWFDNLKPTCCARLLSDIATLYTQKF